MQLNTLTTAVELKFVDDSSPGLFEGYGAVFGNIDSHKDVIAPGAFAESLARHKAQGGRTILPNQTMLGPASHSLKAIRWTRTAGRSRANSGAARWTQRFNVNIACNWPDTSSDPLNWPDAFANDAVNARYRTRKNRALMA